MQQIDGDGDLFKLITISPQEDWLSLAMYNKSIWDTTHGSGVRSILDVLR